MNAQTQDEQNPHLSKRKIVFDTETTGFDENTDRIIEIGAVELIDDLPSGQNYHVFINPGLDENGEQILIPTQATNIHGITDQDVKDCPTFDQIITDFIKFIDDAPIIAHNAKFDEKFLKASMERIGLEFKPSAIIDTLKIAREKFPGSPAGLDALCKRYDISLEDRSKHGALIDSELLAAVYFQLMGGAQQKIDWLKQSEKQHDTSQSHNLFQRTKDTKLVIFEVPPELLKNHQEFCKKLKK